MQFISPFENKCLFVVKKMFTSWIACASLKFAKSLSQKEKKKKEIMSLVYV